MQFVTILFLFGSITASSITANINNSFLNLTVALQNVFDDYKLQIADLSQTIAGLRTNLTTLSIIVMNNSRTCMGVSLASRWRAYYADTLTINVNTSSCRFPTTPKYFTSVTGTSHQYLITSLSAIYAPQPGSFDLYVKANGALASEMLKWATLYSWDIHWIGVY